MSDLALVLAAGIPAAITACASVAIARMGRGLRSKVEETHHATTVDNHATMAPTILDRLAETTAATQALTMAVAEVQGAVADIDDRLGAHLKWSEDETKNLWQGVTEALRHVMHRKDETNDVPHQR